VEELEKRQSCDPGTHRLEQEQAAAILQIERSTLDRKIKSNQLKKDE